MKIECNNCKGRYKAMVRGVRYFHECPQKYNAANNTYKDTINHRNENIVKKDPNKGKIQKDGKGVKNV